MWCVERTPQNYIEVNTVFSQLMDKQYTGTGSSERNNSDWMHYPPICRGKHKCKVQSTYPDYRYHQITLSEFISKMKYTIDDFIAGRVGIRRPRVSDPLLNTFLIELNSSNNPLSQPKEYGDDVIFMQPDKRWNATTNMIWGNKPVVEDIKELFANDSSKHEYVLRPEYRNNTFRKAIATLTTASNSSPENIDKISLSSKFSIDCLRKAGVLDLWYEFKPIGLEIHGHKVVLNGTKITIGCRTFSVSTLNDLISNGVTEVAYGDYKLTATDLNNILNYISKL